ncbi:MAG: ABC transporter ATP-binding protein [Clostridiales bacterium]|jgi:ABC-2 type transport system ATP-binding protein|nr:ABC transporter ATP-binding protein [Clostridiales bacterium]
MDNILEIKGLTKDFGRFKLNNVSLTLPKGFIMGFIGPNGAGKTTTIKSMLGMLNYDSGEIYMLGRDARTDLSSIKQDIGIVMDDPYFHDEWTLANIQTALSPFYKNWDKSKFADYLYKFKLEPKMKFKELSKGMKTTLMLSVALCHDAKLLVLDEPSAGLDPVARNELMDMLIDFISDENRGVFFSSHITSDLEKVADYIIFIENGELVYTGSKDDLMEKYLIVKGGPNEFEFKNKKLIKGLEKGSTGFSGLILNSDKNKFNDNLLFESPNIEEIMIRIYKEGK